MTVVGYINELPIWTIYENPSDYPGKFVVRRGAVMQGGTYYLDPAPSFVGDSLAEARASLPHERGLVRMSRSPGDAPQIVEVWL